MKIWLEIVLLGDVQLPARSATVGAPESLDHLPGSQLLGACAARLYDQLTQSQQWTVFHSGQVRFGAGLPMNDGVPGVQAPASWHHEKGQAFTDSSGRLLQAVVCSTDGLPHDKQWKSLRGHWIDACGRVYRPIHSGSLRTALLHGRARAGFLFGIDCLARGQSLLACIEADVEVDPSLMQRVERSLTGELRVGRSRHAEFGRVQVRRAPGQTVALLTHLLDPMGSEGPGRALALSDLALRDSQTLAPSLDPAVELGPVDHARSMMRSRSYSPFHGKRRRPDLERQVLVSGSVFWVQERPPSVAGDYTHEGLGQLAFEPRLLSRSEWAALPTPSATAKPSSVASRAILEWTNARHNQRRQRDDVIEQVQQWALDLDRFGPMSRSQWGAVRAVGATSRDVDELVTALEGITNHKGVSGNAWARRRIDGQTRGETLIAQLRAVPPSLAPTAAVLLADEMTRRSAREEL